MEEEVKKTNLEDLDAIIAPYNGSTHEFNLIVFNKKTGETILDYPAPVDDYPDYYDFNLILKDAAEGILDFDTRTARKKYLKEKYKREE